MRKLLFLLLFHPVILAAQLTHSVQVGGSTSGPPAPFFTPQHLVIDKGDVVVWSNTSGTHNVNGTTALYPSNPEGFYSGQPQAGIWSFEHTFDIPGVYQYHCDQQGHAATQHGSITVLAAQSVRGQQRVDLRIFPNPTTDHITITSEKDVLRTVELIGSKGQIISTHTVNSGSIGMDLRDVAGGAHLLRITFADGSMITRSIHKLER